jgi:hypothetical protein
MIATLGQVLTAPGIGQGILTGWQVLQIGFISLLYLCAGQRFFRLDT